MRKLKSDEIEELLMTYCPDNERPQVQKSSKSRRLTATERVIAVWLAGITGVAILAFLFAIIFGAFFNL